MIVDDVLGKALNYLHDRPFRNGPSRIREEVNDDRAETSRRASRRRHAATIASHVAYLTRFSGRLRPHRT